jgi:5'-phosphate synthase pdxT subunit
MVTEVTIGVIGIQGAISEHIYSMKKALEETNTQGNVSLIRDKQEINNVDGLILPGGESTTISRILYKTGFFEVITNRIKENNLPILGTCAGCVILSNEISGDSKDVKLLSAMNMQVKRNAFGRQRESFEKNIDIKGFTEPYNAVFIRAPVIEKVWGNCQILAKINKKIVMAKQDKLLALSFHPELTDDLRIHKYFLNMF